MFPPPREGKPRAGETIARRQAPGDPSQVRTPYAPAPRPTRAGALASIVKGLPVAVSAGSPGGPRCAVVPGRVIARAAPLALLRIVVSLVGVGRAGAQDQALGRLALQQAVDARGAQRVGRVEAA